jgi:hypothetical protein
LSKDEDFGRDEAFAISNGQDERLQVLSHKDGVRCNEADLQVKVISRHELADSAGTYLRQSNREQDRETQPWAIKDAAHVAKRARYY